MNTFFKAQLSEFYKSYNWKPTEILIRITTQLTINNSFFFLVGTCPLKDVTQPLGEILTSMKKCTRLPFLDRHRSSTIL